MKVVWLAVTVAVLTLRYPMRPEALGHPILSFGVFEPAHFVMECFR